jgi:glycosyltransferase involved in cell wall biosynthesis
MPVSPRTEDLQIMLEDACIPIDDIDISPQSGNVVRRLNVAFRYLSLQRPSVVHFMMPWWNACEYGVLAAWLARVPVSVATYHVVPRVIDPKVYAGASGFFRRHRHNFIWRRVDKAIAVSDTHRCRLITNGLYSSHQVVEIRNGVELLDHTISNISVDYRRKWGVDEECYLITVVGYLEDVKGHRYLLQALPNILQRHSNVKVVFVGDGVLRDSLKAQVSDSNLSNHVVFAGWQRDVPQILASSDVLVLPSLSEGLPFAILEAMAAKLPVVATRVGGIHEAVIEGQTGLLVEPASAHSLEKAIMSLLDNPALAGAMGKAGQVRARTEFDVMRMVSETCAVYRSLLENASH